MHGKRVEKSQVPRDRDFKLRDRAHARIAVVLRRSAGGESNRDPSGVPEHRSPRVLRVSRASRAHGWILTARCR